MGNQKRAIFDPREQERILAAADRVTELPVLWIMLRTGMHPTNLLRLRRGNLVHDAQGWWLEFKRVKNSKARRELLPSEIAGVLSVYLERAGRPKTRTGLFELVKRVGVRIGYDGVERDGIRNPYLSPMTLRHTACVNFLRQYHGSPDRLKLVARRMGCSEDVVSQNYLDLEEWERIARDETLTPPPVHGNPEAPP